MEPISNRIVATATDLLLRSGSGGTGSGMLRTVNTDPAGYSSQLASDLYDMIEYVFRFIIRAIYTIVSNPFLFVMCGFAVLGMAIGVFGYLLRGD